MFVCNEQLTELALSDHKKLKNWKSEHKDFMYFSFVISNDNYLEWETFLPVMEDN